MKVIEDIQQWQVLRRESKQSIGLVATMGNLHRGHLSLVEQSKRDNDITVVTIYINPTQFNNSDDFSSYPKTLEQDLALLNQYGVNFCLIPDYQQMYPDNFRFQIHETELSTIMEGKHRPGHFSGMLSIVMKLLQLVQPHKAYFGEKDYQQYLLIQQMVNSFFVPTSIISCSTLREPSGLAFSSRNNRLNSTQRKLAEQFARIFQHGENCSDIKRQLEQSGIDVDYIEEYHGRRFAAVHIDDIRLIDNYAIQP